MTTPTAFGPLAGLKVVELGQLIAGPFAGKTLADFGAEVIKIEPPAKEGKPGGDPLREWRLLHNGTSVWWQVQSRNKRSVALDLKDPASRDIVRQLIAEADVVVENFKPGVMEAWGFGYDELSKANPGLIMCRSFQPGFCSTRKFAPSYWPSTSTRYGITASTWSCRVYGGLMMNTPLPARPKPCESGSCTVNRTCSQPLGASASSRLGSCAASSLLTCGYQTM